MSYFLQTSMLSTDTEDSSGQNDANQPVSGQTRQPADIQKVTLMTVHAAKGLEWPVVFIPAVEQGTFPSYRCTEPHEIAEERRLLYVAMTRAQGFLVSTHLSLESETKVQVMSHCQYRMMGGEDNDKMLSEFVGLTVKNKPVSLFSVKSVPD